MPHLLVTPAGHLRWDEAGTMTPALDPVAAAFRNEGAGAGLFRLAALRSSAALPPEVAFWRNFASRHLTALCHTPETDAALEPVPPPDEGSLMQLLLSVPPMRGAEYLTANALREAWEALDRWTRETIGASDSLADFLRTHAPHWHQVGRVCFHLAENRDDEKYPFAFLATYASGLTPAGRPRFLPLSQALTEYAGARNKRALVRLLTPVSQAEKESDLIAGLVKNGEIYHPYPFTPNEAYTFLQEIPRYEEAGLLVRVPDWWRKRRRVQAAVTIGDDGGGAFTASTLLDFKVEAAIDGKALTRRQLEALLAEGSGLRLVKGQWVEVDAEKLREVLDHWKAIEAQAGEGISLVEGMRLLAGAGTDLRAGDVEDELRAWSFVSPGRALRKLLESLRSPEALAAARPGKALRTTLRPYQEHGLTWLNLLSGMGLGACLADDMGLGKTLQVIALLLMRKRSRKQDAPSLLVVPASLLGNWQAEIDRFAPSLRCRTLHRSEMTREDLEAVAAAPAAHLDDVDAVLTTYATLARQDWILKQEWDLCVIDEAQAIKNPGTRQTRQVKKVRARARIALTGTPVENRLSDLWSLFDFINPGLLGSARVFKDFVKRLENRPTEPYRPLRALVRPYILRRLKTDRSIIADLPDKTEVKAYCHLTPKQAALYRAQVEELASLLETVEGMARRGLVLSYLMRFKQLCNHPSQLTGDGLFVARDSGKFGRLGELGTEIAQRQEKVLVFTQFREMTDPLSAFLADLFGREGLVLHGGTPVKKRQSMVDQFQDEGGPPFFVLSLKAGGTGLNLTAASQVIHFDRWWNPAVENQATDRAYRIGQAKNVLVHKFVCPGTLEERIDQLIEEKTRLADEILEGGAENQVTEMSNDELLQLVSLDVKRAVV